MEKNKFSLEDFQKIDWDATLPDNFLELIENDKKENVNNVNGTDNYEQAKKDDLTLVEKDCDLPTDSNSRKISEKKKKNNKENARKKDKRGIDKPKSSLKKHILEAIQNDVGASVDEAKETPKSSLENHILEVIQNDVEASEDENQVTHKSSLQNHILTEIERFEEEEAIVAQIAENVRRIMDEDKYDDVESFENMPNSALESDDSINTTKKKTILKPKSRGNNFRYTEPKKRGVLSRIINRIKYEKEMYNDIERYLEEEYYYVPDDLEQSRTSPKRREQRLYKRVQAYEDARDDITMKRAFIGVKAAAVAALLAGGILGTNYAIDFFKDFLSGPVVFAEENPTFENASEGQKLHAEDVLDKIEYEFKYLSRTEQMDAVIRIGSKTDISENRARAIARDYLNYSDQNWIESILQDSYSYDYAMFSEEEKLELKQLVYEMLDEKVKPWIRSPLKVEELKNRNNESTNEEEMEF